MSEITVRDVRSPITVADGDPGRPGRSLWPCAIALKTELPWIVGTAIAFKVQVWIQACLRGMAWLQGQRAKRRVGK